MSLSYLAHEFVPFIALLFLLWLYFYPALKLIAEYPGLSPFVYGAGVLLINAALGWTVLGWLSLYAEANKTADPPKAAIARALVSLLRSALTVIGALYVLSLLF